MKNNKAFVVGLIALFVIGAAVIFTVKTAISRHTVQVSETKLLISKPEIKVETPTLANPPDPTHALTPPEISHLGDEVLSSLPKLSDLRNLSNEEVHEVAKPVFAGALQIKRFADQLEISMKADAGLVTETQSLAAAGVNFYEKCAVNDQTPESIRAVCYVEFIKLSEKSGHPENLQRLRMPPEVVQIAKSIADAIP
jgi:hypothetical protein